MSVPAPRPNVKMALFALSGNQCAFPACEAPMFEGGSIVGEVAHIRARQPSGPRYDPNIGDEERNSTENLILLCAAHHKIIDDHPEQYDVATLVTMKMQHESRAQVAPSSVLHRLIDLLAPDMPEKWQERPGAPVFRLSLASSRGKGKPWSFDVAVLQVDGGDVGNLRTRFVHGEQPTEWKQPRFRTRGDWFAGTYSFEPRGDPFAVELRFWWDGGERTVTHGWETEDRFQSESIVTYS